MELQRTAGNRAVSSWLRSGAEQLLGVPHDLPISQSGDNYEREADRAAEHVMRLPETRGATTPPDKTSTTPAFTSKVEGQPSDNGGEPLPAPLRTYFEPRFARDLGHVRIHTDDRAAAAAQSLNAKAYTVGRDVMFGRGQFRPGTSAGDRLIAHELTHVVQQSRSRSTSLPGGLTVSRAPAGGLIQRKEAEKEDWDFTPADYAVLIKNKGKLKIASDSAWFPPKLQENLLNTLNYLLDPSRKPSATEGVNVKDLYHGHVAIRKKSSPKGLPAALEKKKEEFEKKQKELYIKATGHEYGEVTKENIKEFTKAEEASLPLAGEALKEAVKSKGLVVIYHTFEMTEPSDLKAKGKSLKPGDPRRNYITPLDTNKPESYTPPDPANASSWTDDFYDVMQFSFLVDRNGEVHIRTGSTTQLSSVTGQPMGP